jgi:uncharacterized protein (UPF0276 family)
MFESDATAGGFPGLSPHAGLGLKPQHYREILASLPDLGFFEIHAENYMGDGGPPHRYLEQVRSYYELSVHGVGLSIGSDQPLDQAHLKRLRVLLSRYEPEMFSEHLAWSTHDGVFLNDLLPVPYDDSTLRRVCEHIDAVQAVLGRRMLLENPSTYLAFERNDIAETQFLREIVGRTGCGLLLDVNNVHVSATNHAYDADSYIDAFPLEHVGEIHLGGFAVEADELGQVLLIDAHGAPVANSVWQLYTRTLARTGAIATLIEWDNDVPAFPMLLTEADRAESLLELHRREARLPVLLDA